MAFSTDTGRQLPSRFAPLRPSGPNGSAEPERSPGIDDPPLLVSRLGKVDYLEAWDLQRRLADDRGHDRIGDVLLLLEHPHTYTLGRRGNEDHILLSPHDLERRAIAVYHVDRGGDVTYHGPGQLVGYPILKLPPERLDYVGYIRDVERAMLAAVRDLGVPAELKERFSGVWIGEEKVCAIGVKVDAAGVTTHGFALNVNTDLSYFGHIVPCGIADKGVTSLDRLLGRPVSPRTVERAVVARLSERFGLAPRTFSRARLERRTR